MGKNIKVFNILYFGEIHDSKVLITQDSTTHKIQSTTVMNN